MLTKVSFRNFKSFSKLTTIDFSSTNYKLLKNTNTYKGILKGALFIGPNASGKTNAIKGIKVLLDLLFAQREISISREQCLFCKKDDIDFEYHFLINNSKIVYEFTINGDNDDIKKEKLYVDEEEFLTRLGQNAETKLTDKKTFTKNDIDSKTLLLKNIYFNTKFSTFSKLKTWFDFLKNSIYFNAVEGSIISYESADEVSLRKYLEKKDVNEINDFFNHFGFNQEIIYSKKQRISPFVTIEIENQPEVFFKRNNMDVWLPYILESLGNQTLLNMLPALLHCVNKTSMFLLDEFSSAFHNELEELIIRYFMNKSKNSQMIFVSHSTNLLKTTLLRPDQVYTFNFADLDGTKIYRISQSQPRQSQNLEKMYLSGLFDGLPNYKKNKN